MAPSYDEILEKIRGTGRFQLKVLVLIFIACFPGALQNMSVVFNMVNHDFRCAIPWLLNDTYTVTSNAQAQWLNQSIPWDAEEENYSQCYQYKPMNVSGEGDPVYSRTETVKCSRFVYDMEGDEATIISQLNLVCDRQLIKTHAKMAFMAGLLVGAPLFGYPADLIGRKKLLILLLLATSLVGVGFGFMSSVPALLLGRFFISIGCMGVFVVVYTMASEMFVPAKRCLSTMTTMYGWCAGLFTLVGLCYFIRDWKLAQLIFSAPGVLFVAYWWLIPESPRWLLSKGRYREAKEVIENIAKTNKVTLPEKYLAELELSTGPSGPEEEEENVKVKEVKVWHIFGHRKVLFIFLVVCYNWLTTSTCYYALTLNVDSLVEGNLYLNFTIMGVLEVLAYVLVHLLIDRTGRKPFYCSCMLLGGLSCLATLGPVLADSDQKWINMVLSLTGKFGVTACFAIIYMYTTELLPTVVRNSGLGICSFVGRLGGTLSPYLADLGRLMGGPMAKVLPLVIIGSASVLAGLLMLLIPETKGRELPETFEDVENFGRSRKTVELEVDAEGGDLPLNPVMTSESKA